MLHNMSLKAFLLRTSFYLSSFSTWKYYKYYHNLLFIGGLNLPNATRIRVKLATIYFKSSWLSQIIKLARDRHRFLDILIVRRCKCCEKIFVVKITLSLPLVDTSQKCQNLPLEGSDNLYWPPPRFYKFMLSPSYLFCLYIYGSR
jgi:hypothetical protein